MPRVMPDKLGPRSEGSIQESSLLPSLAWRPGSGTARRPTPGRSGHQLTDTNVVDGKWRLLVSSAAFYSLGLQHHFRLLTS